MAHVTSRPRFFESTWLGQRLVTHWPQLGQNLALYRKYRNTVEELSNLSDRELADFGMDRSSIHQIAKEHVYGA